MPTALAHSGRPLAAVVVIVVFHFSFHSSRGCGGGGGGRGERTEETESIGGRAIEEGEQRREGRERERELATS